MPEALLQILPLAAASAMSPVIFGISLSLLARNRVKTLIAMLAGSILVAILFNSIGAGLASGASSLVAALAQPPASVDIAFGILLAAFGIKTLLERGRAGMKARPSSGHSLAKWFAAGIVINATNVDGAFLNVTASKLVFDASPALAGALPGLLLADAFLLLPILLPLAIYLAVPKTSQRILAPMREWIEKYGKYVVGIIFLAFGVYLMAKGL